MSRRRSGSSSQDRHARVRTQPSGARAPGAGVPAEGAAAQRTASGPVDGEPVEREALVVTLWFDSGEGTEPYSATVRLRGRRVGSRAMPGRDDTFTHEERVEGVVPGTGPLSVTCWVYGLVPGEWTVTGELVRPGDAVHERRAPGSLKRAAPEPIGPAAWSWRRWRVSGGSSAPLKTRWAMAAPLARIPAVIPGSWPALSGLGILVALSVLVAILAHEQVPVTRSLAVSVLAIGAGLLGAKVWYALLHPGPWRQWIGGWAVDGFLAVGFVVAVAGLVAFRLPIGASLDAAAPGLFFGVAIGRVGCFLTGCCAGRCTRSRWGIWSSDRRVGARRIPTQLLESGAGLLLGILTLLLVLDHVPTAPGLVFVASFGTYVLVRQFLLRLRAESRRYSWDRGLAPRSAL